MKHLLEKISILSLSLMLVSTFAVSPALPRMIDFFGKRGISQSQVELLMTVTSFAIMATLLVNDRLSRVFSERTFVVSGLVLMAVGGTMPVVLSHYYLVFVSRILLGIGIGFINARAIQIVGSHFHGRERTTMLGLRGSAEVLGSALLTALVGLLLRFGWQMSFLVYLLALLILLLFVCFVSSAPEVKKSATKARVMDRQHWQMSLSLAGLAYIAIVINTSLTMRIPVMVTGSGIGSDQQASLILSAMQLMGILAGIAFSWLVRVIKGRLMGLSYMLLGLATFMVSIADSLFILGLATMGLGFVYSVILTLVFHGVTERSEHQLVSQAMTIVLLGCNIGGATSSMLPSLLDGLLPGIGALGAFSALSILLGLSMLFGRQRD